MEAGTGSCCVSCGVVRYCDTDCRDRAAPGHSQECQTVRREKHCSDLVRLIATVCRKVGNLANGGTEVVAGVQVLSPKPPPTYVYCN